MLWKEISERINVHTVVFRFFNPFSSNQTPICIQEGQDVSLKVFDFSTISQRDINSPNIHGMLNIEQRLIIVLMKRYMMDCYLKFSASITRIG